MMKYYKYPNPDITDEEIATEYIEVDGDVVTRMLSVFEYHRYLSSNVDLLLAEGSFEYEELRDDFEEIDPITYDEFNAVWQTHLQQHESRWAEAKKLFPIDSHVIGCIERFFPQGIIIQLGQQVFGVTDYGQARASVDPGFTMRTQYQIAGVVRGYDERNQWIELVSPQIHADKPCDPNT